MRRALYELEDYWEQFTLTPALEEKVAILEGMLPADVQRIIDLGCGNGLITNRLAPRKTVVGIDWSRPALRHLRRAAVCAAAGALPLPARAADLILCSEMLEHLPPADLAATADEILRLAPRYLLISVPDNENLRINELRCPGCGNIFNASHHLRSFSEETLAGLFPCYRVRVVRRAGPPVRGYPLALLRLRQRPGGRWYAIPPGRRVMCPACGNSRFAPASYNPVSLACNALNRIISRRRPYWLFMLLERDANCG